MKVETGSRGAPIPCKSQSSGFSFYHPVASVIVSALEKRINFINRGLYEVRNLQSESFVSEKFAITTYSRLIEGFLRDFIYLQKDVEVKIVGSAASVLEKNKLYESERPAKYRLLFCPIDSITNFARGFSDCGTYFVLQSILPSTAKAKYENIFSIFYSFKMQKFLYAENKGLVYLENKRMKALNRKTSLLVSANTSAIAEGIVSKNLLSSIRAKHVFTKDSIVSDSFEITNGGIDALIYHGIKASDASAMKILAESLGLQASSLKEDEEEVNLFVGIEGVIRQIKSCGVQMNL